jgi:transcription initiation factor TFIID TATA-box-binding protein
MDSLTTHPSNAQQARAFTSTASLSFPGGAGDLTPPGSDKEAMAMAQMNGQNGGNAVTGTGVTPASPATPAATPGATTGSSGIVPTLQ